MLAYAHHGGSGLVNTFVHGAIYSAARRFIRVLPMPVIVAIAVVCISLYCYQAVTRTKRKAKRS